MSEVYSAPRVTATATRNPRLGLMPGRTLDLTTTNSKGEPWDVNDPAKRDEAEKFLHGQQLADWFTSLHCIPQFGQFMRMIGQTAIERADLWLRSINFILPFSGNQSAARAVGPDVGTRSPDAPLAHMLHRFSSNWI